ncbi:MAG: hypothetical protein NTV05_04110 [Acidobacteria bacterium]|nr:hypothetical protein [Acidobacteriota bacterium]
MTFRPTAAAVLAVGALLLPSPARADVTAFIGSLKSTAPQAASQTVSGVAAGVTLVVVGFEFEYSHASEDAAAAKAGLSTGMVSALVRTPTGRIQFYGMVGVGVYRETLGASATTNTMASVGGGATIGLAGPLGVRIDYRLFTLRNPANADTSTRHRIYAGVNLKF